MNFRPAGWSDDEPDDDDDYGYDDYQPRRPVQVPTNGNGTRKVDFAIYNEDEAALLTWIEGCKGKGWDIDYDRATKIFPLIIACSRGWARGVELLLEHGANPNIEHELMTPLLTVCSPGQDPSKSAQCAELLLRFHANVNFRDRRGCVPLMLAAQAKLLPVVNILLNDPEIDLSASDPAGWTALFYAVKSGRKDVVERLLESGIDPDAKAKDGRIAADHIPDSEEEKIEDIKVSVLFEDAIVPTEYSMDHLAEDNFSEDLVSQLPDAQGKGGFSDMVSQILNVAGCRHLILPNAQLPDFLCGDAQVLERVGVMYEFHRKNILKTVHRMHCCQWEESSVPLALNQNRIGLEFTGHVIGGLLHHLVIINGAMEYLDNRIDNIPEGSIHTKKLITSLVDIRTTLDQIEPRIKAVLNHVDRVKSVQECPVDHLGKKPPVRSLSSKITCAVIAFLGACYYWLNK